MRYRFSRETCLRCLMIRGIGGVYGSLMALLEVS